MFSTIKKWFKKSGPEKVLETTDHITAAMVLMLEVAWSDHTIDIDARHVVYTHAAHPVIVEQYNRVVLTRLQAIPDKDEEENSEFIDNWS